MTNEIKKVNYKLSDGREVEITATLIKERIIGHDAWSGDVKKECCEIRLSAKIAGQNLAVNGGLNKIQQKEINGMVVVGTVGPLGLTEDNYSKIENAINELKNGEYYQKWEADKNAAAAENKRYEEQTKKVEDAMTLGGRSF